MKKLNVLPLPTPVQTALHNLQSEIDVLPCYSDRVAKGKQLWATTTKKVVDAKVGVRNVLKKMNGNLCRCSYCEDSCADEIEHIQPKDLYPELTFIWDNYLYSCGPCNGPKNNKFSVYDTVSESIVDVTRKRNAPVTLPHPGEPLLINPRKEDPLDFMVLDLLETFNFLPKEEDEKSLSYHKAIFTIDVLRLNKREVLRKARESEYNKYLALLKQYVNEKESGANKDKLSNIKNFTVNNSHPTVWAEMQRQHTLFNELSALFSSAPEALLW